LAQAVLVQVLEAQQDQVVILQYSVLIMLLVVEVVVL
jgi:hypothetical protein